MVTPTVTPTVTLWTPMVDNAVEVPLPQARGRMPRQGMSQGMPCPQTNVSARGDKNDYVRSVIITPWFQSPVGLVIAPVVYEE